MFKRDEKLKNKDIKKIKKNPLTVSKNKLEIFLTKYKNKYRKDTINKAKNALEIKSNRKNDKQATIRTIASVITVIIGLILLFLSFQTYLNTKQKTNNSEIVNYLTEKTKNLVENYFEVP